jgi:hypothetical protein
MKLLFATLWRHLKASTIIPLKYLSTPTHKQRKFIIQQNVEIKIPFASELSKRARENP